MPRKPANNQPTTKSEQRRLMWGQVGAGTAPELASWDPKGDQLVEALLAIVATGATVVIRPGSGARSIGIGIWEGDERWPPTWLYDTEEVDQWSWKIIQRVKSQEAAD